MSTNPLDLPVGPYTDFFQYWLGLKVDGALPTLQSFDLLAKSALIPNITLFDVEDNRVFVRFVGGGIVSETGRDLTGSYLDQQSNMETIEERALECTRTGEPYFHGYLPITWTSLNYKYYKILGLPTTDETGKVARILYLMNFE
jgi:hypothetical protein